MSAKQKKKTYDNESISLLKDEERVRKRPAVIFGSDDLEGCKHSVFEIVSNSIDEARDGNGDRIIVTRFADNSVEVEDFGRGCPVDFNKTENRYNWELVYCELYAGGKYDNSDYEFSLGLNGLGACATQYASEYMDVTVY
ncbi:MAG: DNA topoisomerase, partial [Oscillospiraceae bacterium]|nr:DNA topoisomerase [Oscillospiraceae bacterium]